ncbi:MAG: polyphosphate kinase 2 family protein [Deltaproteobacteria bacterium]|nr:polyphosphate kinase 2 family protein [Deltaproteobacteria bacterium]
MKSYLVRPGKKLRLSKYRPNDTGDYPNTEDGEKKADQNTRQTLTKLDELQERLYAGKQNGLLIVLQGMDTSGKDGTIKHVMSGCNPIGCVVHSFKVPTEEELSHDYLWRVHQRVPPKGFIGIFNRSHYEDVLVTRVHGMVSKKVVLRRFDEINDFESLLARNGTVILKFFLHLSKEEQRRRLEDRARDPQKRWKFSLNDVKERKYWAAYHQAFQDALEATSTKQAPWYVIPADHKWYRNWVVGKILIETLESMKLKFPPAAPGVNFNRIKVP